MAGERMAQLTWVQISDLHTTTHKREDEGEFVFDRLIEHVKEQVDEQGLDPDVVFVTGDLAFGQTSKTGSGSLEEQYKKAKDRLEKFLYGALPKRSAIPRPVFVVPGNHDVNADR